MEWKGKGPQPGECLGGNGPGGAPLRLGAPSTTPHYNPTCFSSLRGKLATCHCPALDCSRRRSAMVESISTGWYHLGAQGRPTPESESESCSPLATRYHLSAYPVSICPSNSNRKLLCDTFALRFAYTLISFSCSCQVVDLMRGGFLATVSPSKKNRSRSHINGGL